MTAYLCLAIGILLEVAGTCCLKFSEGFTKPIPSVAMFLLYPASLYFASLAIQRGIPLSVAYTLWSGVGICLVVVAGVWLFRQEIDLAGYVGIALIIAGVAVMQFFSKAPRFFD